MQRQTRSLGRAQLFPDLVTVVILAAWSAARAATISWVGGSGDWSVATNWSTGLLPGTNDDVLIDQPGTVTVTHSAGTDTVHSLFCQNTLVLLGGSLTVSNTIQVNNDFVISGGLLRNATVLQGTNGFALKNGNSCVLDGLTINGVLDVENYGGDPTVVNGLVLNGTAYVGSQDGNYYHALRFEGSQTLSGNGAAVLGPNGTCGNGLYVTDPGTTLTIGPGIVVRGADGFVGGACGGPTSASVANYGTIAPDVGGFIVVDGQTITNLGTLQASARSILRVQGLQGSIGNASVADGATLDIDGAYFNEQPRSVTNATLALRGNWTNTASITLSNSTLTVTGTWANAGSILGTNIILNLGGRSTAMGAITVPGSVVNVVGNFTTPQIQSIIYSPNAVRIGLNGVVDNRGQTLLLDASTGYWQLTDGTLWGGAVVATNGIRLYAGNTSGGTRFSPVSTLDGITLDGELDVTGYSSLLRITNGLVLNGSMYVGSQADRTTSDSVQFRGSQTLSGRWRL